MFSLTSSRHVHQLMDKYKVAPKKGLGQNFLADANILRKIVATADVTRSDVVLEIGTGVGALTTALAENAKHVITVETDRSLAPLLAEVLANRDNVELIFGDILKLNPVLLLDRTKPAPKVVANLPYYITTPIIFHLLESAVPWRVLVFLVQKEVATGWLRRPATRYTVPFR